MHSRKRIAAVLLAVSLLGGCDLATLRQGLGPTVAPPAQPKPQPSTGLPKDSAEPPMLVALQQIEVVPGSGAAVPEIRSGALRDAAISYGARGGLARRSWEINQRLEGQALDLNRIFDFRMISIPTASGMIVVPPVITRADDATAVSEDGQSASTSRRVYRILKAAEIRPTVPDWRGFLVRKWEAPEAPSPLLTPRTDEERQLWIKWVEEGWAQGLVQADMIYESDVLRLQRDFKGMALYRELVAVGVVSELYVADSDLGTRSDLSSLQVGSKILRITGPAAFNGTDKWAPIVIDPRFSGTAKKP